MMSFDGWNTRYMGLDMGPAGSDTLMHYRTPGSKNGVRRYQNVDGTWTPLGLRERRAREGFGEAERKLSKAEKKAAKAERKVARIERRKAIGSRIKGNIQAAKDSIRKRSVRNLSDEELKKRIERLNMEKQYKDLKGGGVVKKGIELVNKYFDHKEEKARRAERAAQIKVNELNAQANIARAKADTVRAKMDAKIYKTAAKTNETETARINAKKAYKEYKNSFSLLKAIKRRRAYEVSGKGQEDRRKFDTDQYKMETDRIKANANYNDTLAKYINATKAKDNSREEPFVPGKHARGSKKK